MSKNVIIIGGGVAGMSAAHELAERGFKVTVYEKQEKYVGGKARSVDVPNTGTDTTKPLPGEHGFRFFPGFYRHITDTMKRIPFKGNKHGVFDNLVPTDRVMMARFGKPPLINIVNFPKTIEDLKTFIHAITNSETGLSEQDGDYFAQKLWQLMTSCYERREQVYERIGWWQFLEADKQTPAFKQYFVGGLTRTLVAAQPRQISTKTGGDILLQLLFLMADRHAYTDKVLCGPTNDVWLDPWYDHLTNNLKVNYIKGAEVTNISYKNSSITGITYKNTAGVEVKAQGDYYLFAVPVEVMAGLITPELTEADGTLGYLEELSQDTAWMNGIQFYLNVDVPLTSGHVVFTDSPWALTAISQLQFWKNFKVSEYGNGKVKGIISVDISDWDTPGLSGVKAKDCTSNSQVMQEVWNQLKLSLMQDGKCLLDDSMLIDWYLDGDIVFNEKGCTNAEPLLVNKVNSWSLRPEAYTSITNMFLASDYVRTHTDLATMEGANEAARRAVNAIIQVSGSKESYCKVWDLHEPNALAVLRWLDKQRFRKGAPWKLHIPILFRMLHYINFYYRRLAGATVSSSSNFWTRDR